LKSPLPNFLGFQVLVHEELQGLSFNCFGGSITFCHSHQFTLIKAFQQAFVGLTLLQ
jgi:hypothetical protein